MPETDLQRAQRRARRLYRSKGFQGAYVKGARAALAGQHHDRCPYRNDPRKTWRRVYRLAWLRGHASVTADREER